jgi:hypothetical protein
MSKSLDPSADSVHLNAHTFAKMVLSILEKITSNQRMEFQRITARPTEGDLRLS